MPPTWHCEHSWEIAQKIAGPYFRRQAVTLVAACALVAGLSALGVTAKMSYPVIVILFVVTSYITFSIGGGQRGFQLSKLRCDHFDGSAVEPSTVPSRGQRLTHPAKSSGRASGRPMTA